MIRLASLPSLIEGDPNPPVDDESQRPAPVPQVAATPPHPRRTPHDGGSSAAAHTEDGGGMTGRTTAEIVADLRVKANRWPRWFDTCDEAADRLAELDAEVARLTAPPLWRPFDGSEPDVDPDTGDERKTTDAEGRAT